MFRSLISKKIFLLVTSLMLLVILGFLSLKTYQQKNANNWKVYGNSELGYEIKYPDDWYVKEEYRDHCRSQVFEKVNCLDSLYFENKKEKVVVAGGGDIDETGSFLKIVIYDFKGDPPVSIKEVFSSFPDRLRNIEKMKIGEVETDVWKGRGHADSGVDFIFGGRWYQLHYLSGSQKQFEKDVHIFEDMIDSFKVD